MKTRNIIYPLALTLMLVIPVTRYYVSTPGINACVIDYAGTLGKSDYDGYIYEIKWQRHVEPMSSSANESLKPFRIGTINGCLMSSNNVYYDMNNSFYCSVSYIIQNSPVDPALKTPQWLMKSGDIR